MAQFGWIEKRVTRPPGIRVEPALLPPPLLRVRSSHRLSLSSHSPQHKSKKGEFFSRMVMDLLFSLVIDFRSSLVIDSELLTSQRSGLVPKRARYPEALRSPFQVDGQTNKEQ